MIITSGGGSHFMTAQTLVQVLEQLVSPALELQRARPLGIFNDTYSIHIDKAYSFEH